MTHDQLIKHLHRLEEELQSKASDQHDFALEIRRPTDLRFSPGPGTPHETIWHRGCSYGLWFAFNELNSLLDRFEPERAILRMHCDRVKEYARKYDVVLSEAFADLKDELGYFRDFPEFADTVREALGIDTQRTLSD